MESPGLIDPSIEGFTPLSTYRVRNIGYVCLQNSEGVTLDISQQGLDALESSTPLHSLLDRMGTFISEHDGYREPGAVLQAEASEVLLLSRQLANGATVVANDPELTTIDDVENKRRRSAHLSSVYRPTSAPDAVIKAYDEEPRVGSVQFYIGSWLHHRFKLASNSIYFPRQFAMFTAPGGHRTVVMEHIPGETLEQLGPRLKDDEGHPQETINKFMELTHRHICKEACDHLGDRGLLIMCDLKNTQNIIIDTSEPIDPAKPLDRTINVIDQPSVALPMSMLRHKFQKTVSRRRWQLDSDSSLADNGVAPAPNLELQP